jgi:hypothetical protein
VIPRVPQCSCQRTRKRPLGRTLGGLFLLCTNLVEQGHALRMRSRVNRQSKAQTTQGRRVDIHQARRQERNSPQGLASSQLMDSMNDLKRAITMSVIVSPCWIVANGSPWKVSIMTHGAGVSACRLGKGIA